MNWNDMAESIANELHAKLDYDKYGLPPTAEAWLPKLLKDAVFKGMQYECDCWCQSVR